MRRSATFEAILLITLGTCVACNRGSAAPKRGFNEQSATINLIAITHSSQRQLFHEVAGRNQLPKAVRVELGVIADRNQPFNKTDVVYTNLPMRQLLVAAVSEKYCIVSYWQGGRALYLKTEIFELSDGKAKRIWLSKGQGGLTFRDLKDMIESGHMHNDLAGAPGF
jgi:hypothetical protein